MRRLLPLCLLLLSAVAYAQSQNTANGGSSSGLSIIVPNDTSTGTTFFALTKIVNGKAIIATTTDTVGIKGVCVSGCGKSGNAIIREIGLAPLLFDGTATVDHFIQNSTTTNGDGHDTGANTYPTVIGEVIGQVVIGGVGAGIYTVNLFAPDVISPSGSGSGLPGGLQGQLQYNLNGTTTFGGSRTVSACAFAGATADVQINNAVGALAAQGGVVDATCYGGTNQTIAATINISGSNTKTVTLLVDGATNYNCTITNTTDCINVTAGSAVIGNHTNQVSLGNGAFVLPATATIRSYFHLNASLGFALENININPVAQTSGSVTKGFIWLDSPLQITYLKGININAAWNTKLIAYDNTTAGNTPTGPVDMFEMNLGCNGQATTCIPFQALQTSTTGFVGEINFYSSLMGQPSPGEPIVDLEGTGTAPIQDVSFYGTSIESKSATDIGIFANNVDTLNVAGLIGTSGGSFGADLIKLAGATFLDNVHASGIKNQGWTHTINDTVTGKTFGGTHDVGEYMLVTTAGNEGLVIENVGSAADAIKLIGNGHVSMTGGTPPTITAGCAGAGLINPATPSTDNRGTFTSQSSAATSCTLTFNKTWPQAPLCICGDANASTAPVACSVGATSPTTVIFDFASTTSRVWSYVCF